MRKMFSYLFSKKAKSNFSRAGKFIESGHKNYIYSAWCLQVMSNKVSKNSQDEGYNSEETNRNNSRSTNSRPTSRESSNSAPDINRSDKRYRGEGNYT